MQPDLELALNVVHSNPFDESPSKKPQKGKPAPVDIPTHQFRSLPLERSPAPPDAQELLIKMEVETIDKHLSTGLYFCYNILLYIVAIFMLRSMCYSAYHMISTPSNVYSLIRETSFFAYAICMIVALRSKKVSYAGLGLMLAIVAIILTPITLYLGWSSSGYWTSSEIFKKIAYILAPYCISIFPVLKVRSHLQEREYIVKGSRLSWDLSSYLLKN